jgi:hypothetical protein
MDKTESKFNDDEMMPEYDFTNGVRGKHYHAYRKGHSVIVHQEDGTTQVHHFTLQDGAVMLDPYVQQYFPDSDSVNHALRTLVELVSPIRPKKDVS